MLCPKCSAQNSNENTFCLHCGADLPAVTENLSGKFQQSGNLSETPPSSWFGAAAENLSGHTLDGKYQLEAKIGAGGLGAVYLATRLHIGDKVAVKVLRSDKSGDAQTTERFRLEARMAAHLKHPNAVAIYDYGVTADGLRYLVMEFVEGRTLRQVIAHQGALPMSWVAEINAQICAVLDEAHRIGLIHRDIKPDNFIVQETPAGLRVRVLDFGIAKLSSLGNLNLTQTGTIVGTPRYMSPEQCMSEQLDGRSDIYSLGIVLYEMLCGIVPFNAPSSTAIAVQQVTQPPPPLRQINPNVPPPVEAVVLRALEKKREARPPTAAAFAKELAAAVNNQQEFTRQDISFNFGGAPTNESVQPVSTHVNPPTTRMMPAFSGDRQIAPSGFKATGQTPSRNRKITLLWVAVAIVGFLILGGLGAAAAWLWLRPPIETVKTTENKVSNTDSTNNKNLNKNGNSNNFNTTPSFNPADEELNRLRNERLNAKPGQIDKIAEEFEVAEKKYPNDYRFSYERAKLMLPLPSHHETFHALTEAAATAIKNNQAAQLLSDLTRDKVADFRRLTSHKEWIQIENALKEKNESLLPKEED